MDEREQEWTPEQLAALTRPTNRQRRAWNKLTSRRFKRVRRAAPAARKMQLPKWAMRPHVLGWFESFPPPLSEIPLMDIKPQHWDEPTKPDRWHDGTLLRAQEGEE